MPAPVKHRAVAAVGLLGLVPIGLGLLRGTLGIETAAVRAVVLLAVLMVLEAVVLPIVQSALGPPRRRDADRADPADDLSPAG
jgi:hypothetical protein